MKYWFRIDAYGNKAVPQDFSFKTEEHNTCLELVDMNYLRKTLSPSELGKLITGGLETRIDTDDEDEDEDAEYVKRIRYHS